MPRNNMTDIVVVIKNFLAILGFFGAPLSKPSKFSENLAFSDLMPIGNTEKKTTHQIIIKTTKDPVIDIKF